jgi:hypothetical protein
MTRDCRFAQSTTVPQVRMILRSNREVIEWFQFAGALGTKMEQNEYS